MRGQCLAQTLSESLPFDKLRVRTPPLPYYHLLVPRPQGDDVRGLYPAWPKTAWIERYNSDIVQEINHVYSYCL